MQDSGLQHANGNKMRKVTTFSFCNSTADSNSDRKLLFKKKKKTPKAEKKIVFIFKAVNVMAYNPEEF